MKKDLAATLETPKLAKLFPHVLSQEQIAQLLSRPDSSTPLGLRDRALLETLYATGIRVSELVGLNTGDLNLEAGYAQVFGKGSKERIVPLGSYAIQALGNYLQEGRLKLYRSKRAEDALFLNCRGGRLSRQGFWKILNGYARTAHRCYRYPHMLRHSVPPTFWRTAPTFGWCRNFRPCDISTTQIYTHLTRGHLRQVYEHAHPRAK